MSVSKTQIDRLGDPLKRGPHTESDLRLLEDYRQSFGESYEAVLRTLRERGVAPTGRVAKSTLSIVAKLQRESLRLSQMQDIAGCRVVVRTVEDQDELLASLIAEFPGAAVLDRREKPSHGYRAVHIIPVVSGKPIEIQVRSSLQQLWAELSEKSADVLDPAIKYGGGPPSWVTALTEASEVVEVHEGLQKDYSGLMATQDALNAKLADLRVKIEQASDAIVRVFGEAASGLDKTKGLHR